MDARLLPAWYEGHAIGKGILHIISRKKPGETRIALGTTLKGTRSGPRSYTRKHVRPKKPSSCQFWCTTKDIQFNSETASTTRIFRNPQDVIILTGRSSRPKSRVTKKIKKVATELGARGTYLYTYHDFAKSEAAYRLAGQARKGST